MPSQNINGESEQIASKNKNRIARQIVWVSAGRILAAALQAITLLLLARAVRPTEFGFFSASYGVATFAQTSLDLGLPTLIIRERAKDRAQRIVTSALHFNNVTSFALAGLLISITTYLGFAVDSRFFFLLPLGVWAAAERNADTWLGVVFADGDVSINTINLVSRRAGNLALFLLMTLLFRIEPIFAFSTSSAAAACASWLFAHIYVAKRLPKAAEITPASLLRLSWPYWLNSAATQARNFDTAITSAVAGPIQAGFYAAASKLTGPMRLLATSLASVLLPTSATRNSKTIAGLLKMVLVLTVALAFVYTLVAFLIPLGVRVILGSAYIGAIPALQIAAVGLTFASAAALLDALLQGVGLKHYVANLAVVTTIVCLVGITIGGLASGAVGAAIGLSVSFLVQTVGLLWRILRFIKKQEPNR